MLMTNSHLVDCKTGRGKFLRKTGAHKDIADQFYTLSAALHDLERGIVHPMLMPKKPTGRLADRSDIWRVRVDAANGIV
jgi:hypothetical protein